MDVFCADGNKEYVHESNPFVVAGNRVFHSVYSKAALEAIESDFFVNFVTVHSVTSN